MAERILYLLLFQIHNAIIANKTITMQRKFNLFLIIVAALGAHENLFSQTITIKDELTQLPINKVVITAQLPKPTIRLWATLTNANGEADITTIANEDSIYLRHAAYGTQGFSMTEIKKNKFIISLHLKSFLLDEVVFSANKVGEQKKEVPYSLTVVKSKDINFSNPQTSADMLMNTGGVFIQKSQMGGGSPVLRGFEANRVLIVIDGIRMNNAIYRAGHLQDVITIDPNILDRTEILFGPSSVIYGSDALGGTMNFYTRRPILNSDTGLLANSNAMVRTSTANNELTAHFDLNFGSKKFASLTSVTRSDFGDLKMGSKGNPYQGDFGWCKYYVKQIDGIDSVIINQNPLIQHGTGYSQIDIMQKFLYAQNSKLTHLFNFQISSSSNIPRYDRLALIGSTGLPTYAEWNYGPQKRNLAAYTLNYKNTSGIYDEINLTLSRQAIEQSRNTRKLNDSNRLHQIESVGVYAINTDFRKNFSTGHELRYGIEFTYNDVNSKANSINSSTNIATPAATRYPDGGSSMINSGIYISHSWEISQRLILTDGIRLSYISLKSNWADTSIFHLPFSEAENANVAPSGSVGIVYIPCNQFRLYMNGSTGFRAPNVDDMGKIFDSSPGLLIVPNTNLKPEIAIGGEAGLDWTFSEGAKLDFAAFYTQLTNAIVTKPFQYNGADSVLYDNTMSQVLAQQNIDEAFLYGFTTGITANFNDHFSAQGTATYTYGRYKDVLNDKLIPMDHIPPVFGQVGLVYNTKGFELEFFTRFNGWKHLVDYSPSGEDNLNQATPYGMPSWLTLNLRTELHINKYVGINFAVENIMDLNYRHFASGMNAAGRNFIIALRGNF